MCPLVCTVQALLLFAKTIYPVDVVFKKKKKKSCLSGLRPIKSPYLNITCIRQRFLSRSPSCLSPSAHNVRVFPLLLQSLSVHKQSLQSEYSLIKETNLSPSNQVAELAVVADNSLAL